MNEQFAAMVVWIVTAPDRTGLLQAYKVYPLHGAVPAPFPARGVLFSCSRSITTVLNSLQPIAALGAVPNNTCCQSLT